MVRYPPLKALLAFDAAMKHQSFSLAAEALRVTPGAVGQQIRKLEEWLGVALFVRQVRRVEPTAAAFAYWQRIQPALLQILSASEDVRQRRSTVVVLSMPPSLAAKWFPQRMARLLTCHPDVALHLRASAQPVDFEAEPVDLAIRHFDGRDARLDASLLFHDEARVYCTPGYATARQLRTPEALTGACLLVSNVRPHWEAWFARFSTLTADVLAALPRIHFDQRLMAIEAAREGLGVVLTSPHLVETELAQRALVEPFQACLSFDYGYYIVHARRLPLNPAAERVKHWLLDETAALRSA